MIQETAISKEIADFIKSQNSQQQDKSEDAIQAFADKLASVIVSAIKSADVNIITGLVVVTGANGGGPITATNPAPIVIKEGLS
jgi:hypothetical protein